MRACLSTCKNTACCTFYFSDQRVPSTVQEERKVDNSSMTRRESNKKNDIRGSKLAVFKKLAHGYTRKEVSNT